MADKFPTTLPVATSFTDGEAPLAAKLTSVAAQTKAALRKLEKVVGDIWDINFPYAESETTRLTQKWGKSSSGADLSGAQERGLGIVNIARLIGSAANLNPKMHLGAVQAVTEGVSSGQHSFTLRYKYGSGASFAGADTTAFTTFRANPTELNANGEYSIVDNIVYCFKETVSGVTITYTPASAIFGGPNYSKATFNVIPDPNQTQTGAYAVVVTGPVSGIYTVTLPLCSMQQSNTSLSSITLGTGDVNLDRQLELPSFLVSNFSAAQVVPEGFLILRNKTDGTVYDAATYYYVDELSFEIGDVDLDAAIAAGDVFEVLTVGCDITTTLDDLRNKQFTHSHSGAFGEPPVSVWDLGEIFDDPAPSGFYGPDAMPGNFFPQYLHRDGLQDPSSQNANDRNILRGHLVLGSNVSGPGSYFSSPGNSTSLCFGGWGSAGTTDNIANIARAMRIYSSGGTLWFSMGEQTGADTDFMFKNGRIRPFFQDTLSQPAEGTGFWGMVDATPAATGLASVVVSGVHIWSWKGVVDTTNGAAPQIALNFATEFGAGNIDSATLVVKDIRLLMTAPFGAAGEFYPPGQDDLSAPGCEYNYMWDETNKILYISLIGAEMAANGTAFIRVTFFYSLE